MDGRQFDRLTRALSEAGPRRGLLGLLATLPVLGGLFTLLDPDAVDAKGRRKRRKKRHKHGKGHHKGKRKKKKCKPNSTAKTCAGKCGSVKNNCKKTVGCGSCACDPACDACFTCQEGPNAPGACVVDPAQIGEPCGSDGQVCQADGSCQCDATSCENPTPLCLGGTCGPCSEDPGACLNDACCNADSGACVATCPGICDGDNVCAPCASHGECGSDTLCVDGACLSCDVCASGGAHPTLQEAMNAATPGSTIVICPGTYATAATIFKDLTLVGAGMGTDPGTATILDGGESNRVLNVSSFATATVRALTITRGKTAGYGGGLLNEGVLELQAVTLTDNEAMLAGGAIFNREILTLTDCLVNFNVVVGDDEGAGGGIFIHGDETVTTFVRSVVEFNDAIVGGGILNVEGTVNLTDNSRISDNTATPPAPRGGGLLNSAGTVNISGGSTIAGNTPDNCVNVNGGTGCP